VAALTADGRCRVMAVGALLLVMEAVTAVAIRRRVATVVAGRHTEGRRTAADRHMAAAVDRTAAVAADMGDKFTPGCLPA
jgi:hypothetical protein